MEWTLMREPDMGLQPDQWDLLSPDNPDAAPCSLLSLPHYRRSLVYYLWVSIPMALFTPPTAEGSLVLGRMSSLLLGLLVTTLTYWTSLALFPQRRLLALAASITVSLNHHLAGIMTGINTDAGASFAGSFLFWSLARLHSRGFTPARVAHLAAALALLAFAKTTAWTGYPIAALWLWTMLPSRHRRITAIGTIVAACAGFAALLVSDEPGTAHWFVNDGVRGEPTLADSIPSSEAPDGRRIFALENGYPREGYVQFLPEATVNAIAGTPIAVSGWVQAERGVKLAFPAVDMGADVAASTIEGTGEWQHFTLFARVASDAPYVAILLNPTDDGTTVFYDDLTLSATTHEKNYLRNGSAEKRWPTIRPTLSLLLPTFPSLNLPIWSLLSWARTGPSWVWELPSWLFVMFWSGFSGTQPGLTQLQMLLFVVISGAALIGVLFQVVRLPWLRDHTRQFRHKQSTIILLLATTLLIWTVVVLRAEIYPHRVQIFAWAGTRYALPGIIPLLQLVALGLLTITPRRRQALAVSTIVVILYFTSVYILLHVQVPFYNCPVQPLTRCLLSIQ